MFIRFLCERSKAMPTGCGPKGSSNVVRLKAFGFLSATFLGLAASTQAAIAGVDPGLQLKQDLQQLKARDPLPKGVGLDKTDSKTNQKDYRAGVGSTSPNQVIYLRSVSFTGNKLFATEKLSSPFNDLIGTDVSFSQIQNAVKKVEAIYKDNGYILSSAFLPNQDFTKGRISIQIVEGYLQSYEVRGGSDSMRSYVENMLSPLKSSISESQPFNFNTLERQLLLIKNFNAVDFKSTMAKGTKFGSSVLYIDIDPKPIRAGISADTWVPDRLGSYKINADAQFVTPTSQPIKLFVSGSVANEDLNGDFWEKPKDDKGLRNLYTSLATPIGNTGFMFTGSYAQSDTRSEDLISGAPNTWTRGESKLYTVGFSHPIHVGRNSFSKIGLTGTYQNSTEDLIVDGWNSANLSTNKIRAVRLGVDGYNASSTFSNQYSLKVSRGLDIMDNDLDTYDLPSNPNYTTEFTSFELFLSRDQRIASSNTFFTLKGLGQYSLDGLPVPEQISFGGQNFGRGYSKSTIMGDTGGMGSLELSQLIPISDDSSLKPFAFYDHGFTTHESGDLGTEEASTYGFGLRANLTKTLNVEAGVGVPLTNTLENSDTGFDHANYFIKGGIRF